MKNLFPVLIIACTLLGCITKSTNNKQQKDSLLNNSQTISKSKSAAFNAFLAKFDLLSLPVDIQTLKISADTAKKFAASDNQFVNSAFPDETYAYGLLADTANSYKFIWLEPAEIEIPVIATFTKDGKFIKKEYLGVGQCGSDCCYECNEFIQINKDLTIISTDSIKSCTCDVNGPISNTTEKYVLIKTGKINSDGSIMMTEFSKRDKHRTL